MTEEFYEAPRDTFLAPVWRKPRHCTPPRRTEEEAMKRRQDLHEASQKRKQLPL